MTDKFTLDMVSIRLITEKKLYSDLVISSPENAVELLGKELASFDREAVAIINLTSSAKPINAHIASIGTLNSASISPREVFKASILSNAAAFLIMHNHPSGSLKPSQEDYNMTGNLIIASNIMGIPLFDHIIVGFNNGTLDYHSFRANNEFDYSVKSPLDLNTYLRILHEKIMLRHPKAFQRYLQNIKIRSQGMKGVIKPTCNILTI